MWELDASETKAAVGVHSLMAVSLAVLKAGMLFKHHNNNPTLLQGAAIQQTAPFRHIRSPPQSIIAPYSMPILVSALFHPKAAGTSVLTPDRRIKHGQVESSDATVCISSLDLASASSSPFRTSRFYSSSFRFTSKKTLDSGLVIVYRRQLQRSGARI